MNSTTSKQVKSGYVTLLGLPNSGKSSFLNALLGEDLAIVTPKAQTTWKNLQGYLVREDLELVITDTPGIQTKLSESTKALNQAIHQNALDALSNAVKSDTENEIVALMIDAREAQYSASLFDELKNMLVKRKIKIPFKTRVLPVLNKSDLVKDLEARKSIEENVLSFARQISETVENAIWVSSNTKEGVSEWISAVKGLMPTAASGSLFNVDDLSDKSVRAFCEDYIREQCFFNLQQEMPYSVAVEILTFDEKDPKLTRIEAELHVERESQKRMVIGKGGTVLKKIGSNARLKAEKFLNKKVYLGLHVKVTPNWSKDSAAIKRLGYSI